MKKLIIAASVLFCLGVSATVYAGPWPTGQWQMKAYNDETGNSFQVMHGMCIVGDGTWYSTTFPNWGGHWFKKGNDLHLHGNYDNGLGNDAFELTKIAGWHMDGYWQEFRDNITTSDFWATTRWQKKSNQCDSLRAQAVEPDANPAGGE